MRHGPVVTKVCSLKNLKTRFLPCSIPHYFTSKLVFKRNSLLFTLKYSVNSDNINVVRNENLTDYDLKDDESKNN